jgi:hypothetical protein
VIGEGEEDVEMCGGDGYSGVMMQEDLREIIIDAESKV